MINASKGKHNSGNKAGLNAKKDWIWRKNMVGLNSINYYLDCERMCVVWITEFQ
ncbi:hypothetical protein HMPREF0496_1119 [Lentilactobacillus hilgardii ATCC 27305]|nr:hypothetical protein HMPREF0496_1119 [Lentilactobacillus hilgardii ATCC 27305]